MDGYEPEGLLSAPRVGWASWSALLTGTFLACTLAAVSRLALRATHKVDRDTPIPLGAFLIIGALAALLIDTTT